MIEEPGEECEAQCAWCETPLERGIVIEVETDEGIDEKWYCNFDCVIAAL